MCLANDSLKLNFTSIWGLRSNFVLDCESSLESNSPGILAICVTNLNNSVDFGNFSAKGYLPLIRTDSPLLICMVLQFTWRKSFLLHRTNLYKNLQILSYVFDWLYFIQFLTSFSTIDHLLRFYAMFSMLFHLT